jgi:hypothetical protein
VYGRETGETPKKLLFRAQSAPDWSRKAPAGVPHGESAEAVQNDDELDVCRTVATPRTSYTAGFR